MTVHPLIEGLRAEILNHLRHSDSSTAGDADDIVLLIDARLGPVLNAADDALDAAAILVDDIPNVDAYQWAKPFKIAFNKWARLDAVVRDGQGRGSDAPRR